MPLTLPHIVTVVRLNGFISGSLLQQRPLCKPPMFHLDCVQYCGDTRLWSLCIQNCAKWAHFSNLVTFIAKLKCEYSLHTTVHVVSQAFTTHCQWWEGDSGRKDLVLWFAPVYNTHCNGNTVSKTKGASLSQILSYYRAAVNLPCDSFRLKSNVILSCF